METKRGNEQKLNQIITRKSKEREKRKLNKEQTINEKMASENKIKIN